MSFARSARKTYFDDVTKNKENLPGPEKYNPNSDEVNKIFISISVNFKTNWLSRFGAITVRMARFVKNQSRSILVFLVINSSCLQLV
jgi:hypothetical protein